MCQYRPMFYFHSQCFVRYIIPNLSAVSAWETEARSEETEPLRLHSGLQTSNVQLLIPAPSVVRRTLASIHRTVLHGEGKPVLLCTAGGNEEEIKFLVPTRVQGQSKHNNPRRDWWEPCTPQAENLHLPDLRGPFVCSKVWKACAWDSREWDQVGSFLASPRFLICLPP